MRIALISSVKRLPDGEMRAEQELAGRSVLSWQVDYALSAGCERIICLCDVPAPHIIEQQHRIEAKDLGFHMVRSPLQIVGLVKPDDQMLMVLDGLIPPDGAMDLDSQETQGEQFVILTLPSDHPSTHEHSEDFERIDRDRHWAGLALISGAAVGGLEEMPGDGDAMSLLLRLGLQKGAPCTPLLTDLVDSGQWLLASDTQTIEKRTKTLFDENMPRCHWGGPAASLAAVIVGISGPYWLRAGSSLVAGLAIGLMGLAGALSAYGYAVGGLGLAVIAAFCAKLSLSAHSLKLAICAKDQSPIWARFLGPVTACLSTFVLICGLVGPYGWPVQISIPVLAVGLGYLAGKDRHLQLSAFWRDSPTHLALFLAATLLGALFEALLVFALGALLQLMLRTSLKSDSV